MTDTPQLDPEERAAADWLSRHRPVPSPAARRRGRATVRAALSRERVRHQAAVLLATGGVALALAAAVVVVG